MMIRDNATVEGHTLEYRYSGTGSMDPWTRKYLKDNDMLGGMLCTADVAYFILVDGDTVYKKFGNLSRFEDVKEMTSWSDVQEWLNKNCEEPYSLQERIQQYAKRNDRS